MRIYVKIVDQYGRKVVRPDCELSAKLAALAGTKTLTESALRIIESMGYEIGVNHPTDWRVANG